LRVEIVILKKQSITIPTPLRNANSKLILAFKGEGPAWMPFPAIAVRTPIAKFFLWLETWVAIAHALGVSISDLVKDVPTGHPEEPKPAPKRKRKGSNVARRDSASLQGTDRHAPSLKNLDMQRKLADIEGEVVKMTFAANAKDAEIAKCKQRIAELEELLRFKEKLVLSGRLYYEADAAGKPVVNPYCPNCWESGKVVIHIQPEPDLPFSTCNRCKGRFGPDTR